MQQGPSEPIPSLVATIAPGGPPPADELARLLMSAALELSAAPERRLAPLGLPVVAGRFHLGRLRPLVQHEGSAPVVVVVGFALACWLGPDAAAAPALGRLRHRTETHVDSRGRLRLHRRVRTYLDVADPAAFEVVPVPLDGGVLLVPLENFERRAEEVQRCS